MEKIKIKDFIHATVYNIKGISPLRSIENQFGTIEKFYLINNSNLEIFKKERFYPDFKDKKIEDLKWLLNRYAVSIVNKSYLMNLFLNKDIYLLLNPENWTKTNVVINNKPLKTQYHEN
tara:strand:- start:189 stop:545 length:357 start_codon:yes stop_codon:yes gene_type:complete